MLPAILQKAWRFAARLSDSKSFPTGVKAGLITGFLLIFLLSIKNINFSTKTVSKFSKTSTITPTPTPVPKYFHYPIPVPLPQGKQTYLVSRGAGSPGPNIQQVSIEPFDPKKGEAQKIDVKVGSNAAMKAVKVSVNTDYDVKTYDAKLKEGTKINGVWEAEVIANDSHDYVYRVKVDAQDSKEEASVTVTIR